MEMRQPIFLKVGRSMYIDGFGKLVDLEWKNHFTAQNAVPLKSTTTKCVMANQIVLRLGGTRTQNWKNFQKNEKK